MRIQRKVKKVKGKGERRGRGVTEERFRVVHDYRSIIFSLLFL